VVPNELLDPIVDQISLPVVNMNNCAFLDYNPPPAPDCIAQVMPNRQLDQAILDQGLQEVEQLLQAKGGKTLEDFELPILAQLVALGDTVVFEEWARYNVTRQAQQLDRDVPLLNQHQRSIYDNVIDVVHDPKLLDKTFFVDGLGGAGKTFLYGCLFSRVRSTGDIVLSMASFGIVALLLEGGCTVHSCFKIPVAGLCGSSVCYVPLNSPQATLIRATCLIMWDEAPMAHMQVFEVVNRMLQHVMGVVDPALKDMRFGGKVVVMGNDFRQILLVVPWGRKGQIVDASLKRSEVLWHCVKVCQLHENMHVQRLLAQGGTNVAADAQQQQAWADYLQHIGEGTKQVFPEVGEEAVLIPEGMCCQGDTIDSLVDEVYGDLGHFTDS